MKRWIIVWLLRKLGATQKVRSYGLPDMPVYAIVVEGSRLADVTANRMRGIALARHEHANGKSVILCRYEATTEETFL